MDTSVALVQTYLRVNGYFTVAEFPVVETRRRGKYRDLRTLTDIDIMAFRFPRALQQNPDSAGPGTSIQHSDVSRLFCCGPIAALAKEPGPFL